MKGRYHMVDTKEEIVKQSSPVFEFRFDSWFISEILLLNFNIGLSYNSSTLMGLLTDWDSLIIDHGLDCNS